MKFHEYPFLTKRSKKILIPLKSTVHFQYLNKYVNDELYLDYIFYNNEINHSLLNFQNLYKNFDESLLEQFPINVKFFKNKLVVIDGLHRLTCFITLNPNLKSIPKKYVRIINGKVSEDNQINLKSYENTILKKARKNIGKIFYNGWKKNSTFQIGYHSLNCFNLNLIGQRDCYKRINEISKVFDLDNLNILDIGCNIGGMLWHIDNPGQMIGVDYDSNAINVAKTIKKLLLSQDTELAARYNFYRYDLNNLYNLQKIVNKINYNIDVIFLFSMGSWLDNFTEVLNFCSKNARYLIFETNNSTEFESQKTKLNELYKSCIPLNSRSLDDNSGNFSRQLFLYSN